MHNLDKSLRVAKNNIVPGGQSKKYNKSFRGEVQIMSKRHVLTLMSIFLVLALALAACSSADPTATPAPAATEAPMAEPTEEMMEEPTEEPMAESNTIVDIAVADGRFKTLVAAVEA
ncbi:MAG: hypothetical protein KDE29_08800, partial [Anaerolineales bacterium]|nr:hypothetical protein [Anaerolineales bacterium]